MSDTKQCPQCGSKSAKEQLDAIQLARELGYRDGHLAARNEMKSQPSPAVAPSGWDARFYAFGKLNILLDLVLPRNAQLTAEQADAVHKLADQIAKDLTGGDYVYVERT